jgi:hypothetical protein
MVLYTQLRFPICLLIAVRKSLPLLLNLYWRSRSFWNAVWNYAYTISSVTGLEPSMPLRCVAASSVNSVCCTCITCRPSALIRNVLRGGRRLRVSYIEEPACVKSLLRIECGPLVLFIVRTRYPSSCTCRKEVTIWMWFLRNLSAWCYLYRHWYSKMRNAQSTEFLYHNISCCSRSSNPIKTPHIINSIL